MDSFLPLGGFQLPFQRRLSRLYNDTKKSSDFVSNPVQNAEDPEIKALHRKLRIQKDRFVSWGLEWSDPNQSAEIDESLSKAGLSEIVGSIMSTIKDILAEAEPLWQSSKRQLASERRSDKASGDQKISLVVWDRGRFEDLVRDLTTSIDTLYDLSRTRSSAALSSQQARARLYKSSSSTEELRPFESTRMQTPQQIDPLTLTNLREMQAEPMTEPSIGASRREVVFMSKQAWSETAQRTGRQPWAPLLLEFAGFDSIYSTTGIMPPMARFEKMSAGLQQESQRSPGAWTGLPRLLGYFEDLERSRLGLVYHFPQGFNAVSFEHYTQNPLYNLCTLGDLLSRPDFEPRLEAKFRLAYNLANTVFDMHVRGITHGNLVDSNVSFCNAANTEPGTTTGEVDVRRPLVSSFDLFPDASTEEAPSPFLRLFRHPLDPRTMSQSPITDRTDSRILDLYSLAMVLLSIGLWTKLENLVPDPSSPSIPESVLEQLAIRCGTLYTKAVQSCWDAVDKELSGRCTGEELLSSVQVKASRYLEACCILDGVSGLEERLSQDLGDDLISSTGRTAQRSQSGPSTESKPADVVSHKAATMAQSRIVPEPPSEKGEFFKPSMGEKPKQISPIKPEPTKLRLFPHVPLPPDAIDKWNTVVMPQINHALRHFYRKNPESVEISLESIGVSPQKTRPTVLVVCTSVSKVKAILTRKMSELSDGAQGFGLKVCRGQVLRSRKEPKSVKRSMAEGDDEEQGDDREIVPANPEFQERPNNGASIGAWIGDRHLPPVSFGGLVIVDDKPYGMTVHHMLDDPDQAHHASSQDETKPTLRSMARPDDVRFDWYADSSGESSGTEDFACEFSDSESETSETDITSDASDDEDEDSEDEDGEYNEQGDIPGVEPGCGEGYIVTQPAMDDVEEGFYPSPETAAEDHLDTFRLGEIYASSGIRRRRQNGLVHEIDWALFEFHDDRLPDDNLIPRITTNVSSAPGARSSSEGIDLHPTTVAPASALPGLEVQCVARTSGLQGGLILPALTSVKIFGRASPSHTYQVTSTAAEKPTEQIPDGKQLPLGIPGDSGAWVIERRHGRVCGHVLAWSARKHVAYICPMDVLLLDIAETLAASDIKLPGGETIVRLADEEEEHVKHPSSRLREEEPSSSPFLDPQDDLDDLLDEEADDDDEPPALISRPDEVGRSGSKRERTVVTAEESKSAVTGDHKVHGQVDNPGALDLPGKMESLGIGDGQIGVGMCS